MSWYQLQVLAEGAVPAAQELHLTGCAVAAKDSFAVVVVEGGPKALKFYKKLMLQRMKWHITVEEEKARAEGEDADDEPAAGQGEGEPPAALIISYPLLTAVLASASVVYPSTSSRGCYSISPKAQNVMRKDRRQFCPSRSHLTDLPAQE